MQMFLCQLFSLRQLLDPSETVLLLGFVEFYGEGVPLLHSEEGGMCWVWGGVKRRDPSSLVVLGHQNLRAAQSCDHVKGIQMLSSGSASSHLPASEKGIHAFMIIKLSHC